MGSRRMKWAMAGMIVVFMVVFAVIAIVNLDTVKQKLGLSEREPVQEEMTAQEEEVETEDGQIGGDLSAFLMDETFFDPEVKFKSIESYSGRSVSLMMSSVAKDLRIMVVDSVGRLVTGADFTVTIQDVGEYTDNDKDGVIYVDGLRSGEYSVFLNEKDGFRVPNTITTIQVRQDIEYRVLDIYCPESTLKIGYMLQRDHLFEWRTVYQNVILGLELTHSLTKENTDYILKLLKDYGLIGFKDKKPSELSGGMRQRAALIRTMAVHPDLLLLDEPFSALDFQTRLSVSADIANIIRETGKTALLITHDLSEAITLADRVIVLSRRPAGVKREMEIRYEIGREDPLAVRGTAAYQEYFNQLWEVLTDDKTIA